MSDNVIIGQFGKEARGENKNALPTNRESFFKHWNEEIRKVHNLTDRQIIHRCLDLVLYGDGTPVVKIDKAAITFRKIDYDYDDFVSVYLARGAVLGALGPILFLRSLLSSEYAKKEGQDAKRVFNMASKYIGYILQYENHCEPIIMVNDSPTPAIIFIYKTEADKIIELSFNMI